MNYNQEIRLKNAEAKWNEASNWGYHRINERIAVLEEYEKIKKEIDNVAFSKEEVETLLTEYKNVTKTMQELVCRIPK